MDEDRVIPARERAAIEGHVKRLRRIKRLKLHPDIIRIAHPATLEWLEKSGKHSADELFDICISPYFSPSEGVIAWGYTYHPAMLNERLAKRKKLSTAAV